jgi:Holliday junction resolvase RusA-like endonuclease
MDNSIIVEMSPISINECYYGRHLPTRKYKEFKEEANYLLLPYKKKYKGCVFINYIFYLVNFWKRDVDNCVKPIQDCLVRNGIILDDRYIMGFSAKKKRSFEDKILIEIEEIGESEVEKY